MAVVIIEETITSEQLDLVKEEHGDYVKVVVDIDKGFLAAGGEWHADAEKILLGQGSRQESLWGGGVDVRESIIEFTSLINMRPRVSRSQEVLDPAVRATMEEIIRRIFGI